MFAHTLSTRPRALAAIAIAVMLLALGTTLAPAAPPTRARAQAPLSVTGIESQLLAVASAVEGANLSTSRKTQLLGQLTTLSSRLQTAEGTQRRLDTQNQGLDLLLVAQVNTTAAINRIGSDLQINLDHLDASVNAAVDADISATVGGITTTVHASADQIKADLNAQADRLLVDITADLNVIKIVTLDARAHVDAQRLKVSVHALVTKLNLDLRALMRDLNVMAKADIHAALSAEARLRAGLTARLDGLTAQVEGGLNGRVKLLQGQIAQTQAALDASLGPISAALAAIQGGLEMARLPVIGAARPQAAAGAYGAGARGGPL